MIEHRFIIGFARNKDTLMGKGMDAPEITFGRSEVRVQAQTHNEARLIAQQMVATRGVEPTSCRLIGVRVRG